jgi:Tfp pilus assembly protein PilP
MFATRSWTPKPAAAQKPEAPKPPPNPYRFAGTVQHDGARKVFLLLGDRVFEAKEGEYLEQGFRVQSVTDDAVTLVYVPLDMPVTMALVFQEAAAAAGATAQPPSGTQSPR